MALFVVDATYKQRHGFLETVHGHWVQNRPTFVIKYVGF